MRELVRLDRFARRHPHEHDDVALLASRERREHVVRRERVLDVGERKEIVFAFEDIAEVVGVGAVREHVGDLKLLAGLRVGVSGHAHDELLAA